MPEKMPGYGILPESNPFRSGSGGADIKAEKVASQEVEPNEKAMEKVVDFLETKDLKYRDFYANNPKHLHMLAASFETGIPTPMTSFFYEPFGRFDEEAKAKLRTGETERHKANVFYPEGIINIYRDELLGTHETKKWPDDSYVSDVYYEGSAIVYALYDFFKSLDTEQLGELARLSGLNAGDLTNIERSDLETAFSSRYDPDGVPKKLLAIFGNKEAWEFVRRNWLRSFFASSIYKPRSGESPRMIRIGGKEYDRDKLGEGLQPWGYMLHLGFVLAPGTEVAVSPHGDYYTQATIVSPRVAPKKILGIYINTDERNNINMRAGEEWVTNDIPAPKKSSFRASVLEQLENTVYKSPKHPLEYLLLYYPRPFNIFLENNGIELEKLKGYYEEFTKLKESAKNKMYKEDKEVADPIHEELEEKLGVEVYSRLQELAERFLKEKAPIKDGETFMTGLIRMAERHQLPIYNIRGDLLWPKKMDHEEVAKQVAEKEAAKAEDVKAKSRVSHEQ